MRSRVRRDASASPGCPAAPRSAPPPPRAGPGGGPAPGILRALSDGHGHSMTDLAEAVLMAHPTLTKAVDRLVDDAVVYRRQDTTDRRRVAVYLSDLGRDLVARLDRRAAGHHAEVAAAFGAERTDNLMRELEALAAACKNRD
ncbi:MarR family winged helix-turn-helix transcriptional regulator [Actinoplanes sp. NPDC051470]|uniref:MarR family winged helix-turn-helix transcriptional regulator n=1 Tax=Actinoplanes sp. NPDC051470 TaxID=3157224 RepID=UPI003413917A